MSGKGWVKGRKHESESKVARKRGEETGSNVRSCQPARRRKKPNFLDKGDEFAATATSHPSRNIRRMQTRLPRTNLLAPYKERKRKGRSNGSIQRGHAAPGRLSRRKKRNWWGSGRAGGLPFRKKKANAPATRGPPVEKRIELKGFSRVPQKKRKTSGRGKEKIKKKAKPTQTPQAKNRTRQKRKKTVREGKPSKKEKKCRRRQKKHA